jgi:hypothetical protein
MAWHQQIGIHGDSRRTLASISGSESCSSPDRDRVTSSFVVGSRRSRYHLLRWWMRLCELLSNWEKRQDASLIYQKMPEMMIDEGYQHDVSLIETRPGTQIDTLNISLISLMRFSGMALVRCYSECFWSGDLRAFVSEIGEIMKRLQGTNCNCCIFGRDARGASSYGVDPIPIHQRVSVPYPVWTRISGQSSISRVSSVTDVHQSWCLVDIKTSVRGCLMNSWSFDRGIVSQRSRLERQISVKESNLHSQ